MSEPPQAPWLTIPALIDDAVARYGDLEAIVDGEVRWTYRELGEQVHRCARALIAAGVSHGERVSVWAPNTWEWVVAALSIHSVGAVLVPINTRFRGAEAAYVLRRAGVRRVFLMSEFLGTDYLSMLRAEPDLEVEAPIVLRGPVSGDAVTFEEFLAGGDAVDDVERAKRAAAVDASDACHILFTSGTTGAPKGAVLEHGRVCAGYAAYCANIGMRTGDRYLIVLPFFHSFGLNAGIVACLMVGATIVPELVFDPSTVIARIRDEGITAFPGPPTVFQALLSDPAAVDGSLASLRLSVVSAAAIPVELIRQMRSVLKIDTIITGYGLTEASGIVTMCRSGDEPEIIASTAGRPVDGVQIRLVDPQGADVQVGQEGEILVSGYTLMRGYLDAPEQTSEAIDADGWLHTGDVGRIRPDGNLVVTDRIKDMFIVGGFNTYPAEIEGVLAEHPAVEMVSVVGVPDERLGEVGAAFVIPRPHEAVDAEGLIAWAEGKMANYKVPRYVHLVEQLPLNATGKVLKAELRAQANADLQGA